MKMLRNLRAWLFGCHSTWLDPQGETYYCTLDWDHPGDHEAHTCRCAGKGRCSEGPVETWAPQASHA